MSPKKTQSVNSLSLTLSHTITQNARRGVSQNGAWTGGLTPRELRAVQHADALGLNKAAITGRPATQFLELLRRGCATAAAGKGYSSTERN